MPLVAIILAIANLLQVGSYSTQLLFQVAYKRMKAQYPPAKNGNFGKERGAPESTRMMKNRSYVGETIKVPKSRYKVGDKLHAIKIKIQSLLLLQSVLGQ